MSEILRTHDLRAGYGLIEVLHGVNINVDAGEIVVVLGANGAGKTTMMRAITGMIPRTGVVDFLADDIAHLSAHKVTARGIAHVPQGRGTFPELTVEENLRIGAHSRRDSFAADIDYWYGVFPRLQERRLQRAGSLSGGEQQMLAIARALMSRPKLLLCDEPSLGLAPLVTRELFEVLQRLNAETGLSVLLVEQNANLALEIASRVYLLETGEIVSSGTPDEYMNNDAVRKSYLGH
jgi:branched-chain amino acid transport system ATP-binding protein